MYRLKCVFVRLFQGQACLMVLRALQSKDVKNLMSDAQGTEIHQKIVDQLAKVEFSPFNGQRCWNIISWHQF